MLLLDFRATASRSTCWPFRGSGSGCAREEREADPEEHRRAQRVRAHRRERGNGRQPDPPRRHRSRPPAPVRPGLPGPQVRRLTLATITFPTETSPGSPRRSTRRCSSRKERRSAPGSAQAHPVVDPSRRGNGRQPGQVLAQGGRSRPPARPQGLDPGYAARARATHKSVIVDRGSHWLNVFQDGKRFPYAGRDRTGRPADAARALLRRGEVPAARERAVSCVCARAERPRRSPGLRAWRRDRHPRDPAGLDARP